jgi:uncharacterized protein YydD (DUF2326 family)
MIPKGFLMMLKQLLPAFGIKIDPTEVEKLFENIKIWLPQLVVYTREKLDALERNQIELREQLNRIENSLKQEKLAPPMVWVGNGDTPNGR